jgi:hypothetical protein
MSEQRVDIELRAELTALLDRQDGPHPRWAAAPAAARIASSEARPRWSVIRVAGALAASLAIVVLAVVVTSQSGRTPAASGGPTAAPWPSAMPADTTPSVGEVGLGQVAVATSDGHPAVLVRVSPETSAADRVVYRVEYRVVGGLTSRFGSDRLVVVRNGVVTSQRFDNPSAADPLEVLPGTPVGTERSTTVTIDAADNQNVDLGFIGAGTQPAFWFPIHRAAVSQLTPAGCPTLKDYQAAAALPSMTPAPLSFAPVASNTPPSSGVLTPGQVGVVAAPDGSPGALVRVSNVRFCDRLPNVRPEEDTFGMPGDYEILLADVELKVLKSGSLNEAFIPGSRPVWAKWRGMETVGPTLADTFPRGIYETSIAMDAGFAVSGTMAWIVGSDRLGGRVAIDVGPKDAPLFEYLVRDGSMDHPSGGRPVETLAPGASPSTGILAPDARAVLSADGALMPVFVGGVAVVDGYPRAMPSTPGDKFIEVFARFGSPTATYTIDARDWVLVGPYGRDLPRLQDPGTSDGSQALPSFAFPWSESRRVGPADGFPFRLYVIAEIPPTGRVTLEYRPHGGRAQVTWIVRDH